MKIEKVYTIIYFENILHPIPSPIPCFFILFYFPVQFFLWKTKMLYSFIKTTTFAIWAAKTNRPTRCLWRASSRERPRFTAKTAALSALNHFIQRNERTKLGMRNAFLISALIDFFIFILLLWNESELCDSLSGYFIKNRCNFSDMRYLNLHLSTMGGL